MAEFQLTHVALVGARMEMFQPLGFRARSEMALRRVMPNFSQPYATQSRQALSRIFGQQLPIWVHNIIFDDGFPARDTLLMSLRRFEGELRDNRNNEVIAAVLSAGFGNRQLDPLDLPGTMPMRQRCAMLMQIGPWQEAYEELEENLTQTLCDNADALDSWVARARSGTGQAIAV